ncbi:MAG: DUF2283 domain-containing protein [Desulfomonilaceae bacterium]
MRVVTLFFDRNMRGMATKLKIHREADPLYLALDESDVVDSEEVSPGIIVDYSADNKAVGIEMFYLSKRTPKLDTGKLLLETVRALGLQ